LNSLFTFSLFLFFAFLPLTGCAPKAPPFDGQAAYGELLKQCSFGPRNPGSEGHRVCGEYLAGRLRELTDEVVEQRFTHRDSASGDSFELTNYIGIVNPKQGKRVLLAAHWDTRPRADQDPDPAKTRPAVGVDIVFFDGEDYGREGPGGKLGDYFLGSQYFARHLGPYRPEYGILLDMVGDKDLSIPLEANSLRAAPLVMEKIWKAARLLNVPAFKQAQGPAVSDDHIPLLIAGIPVVDLIDFDYPRWHTLGDTPEATSPASLEAVGRVVALVVYSEK